ncbi:MAG: c-type cytochrome [Alphaproteobacteria bacterium]
MVGNPKRYFPALAVSGLLWALQGVPNAVAEPIEPEMTPDLRAGKQAYKVRCAECHGGRGGGAEKGPPLVHRLYNPGHHGDAAFYRAVRQGSKEHHWKFGDMKPVPDVTDEEFEALMRYVRAVQRANGVF